MDRAPASTAAFDGLIGALTEIRNGYIQSGERHRDDLEVVEGIRYVTHLLSEAFELLLEGDPERPRFSAMVSPARKYLGDNPDAIYYQAVIRGDRSYRIAGRRDGQCYISFTIHAADPAGGINGPVLADVNDDSLDIAADGSFELVLSPDKHDGNWIELPPSAKYVIVRNYFLREHSVQNDPDTAISIDIQPIDNPGPAPVVDDATLAARLSDVSAFLKATTMGMRVFGGPATVPFVSDVPNTVGTPWCFRNAGVDAAGAVDIYYSSGTFDLAPDEAMVMEGVLPASRFTNVVLWNVHMQTLDFRTRRCSLNAEQMVTDQAGNYRIMISATDPGVPNWIDSQGHRRGTVFWRFLLPESQPDTPRCRVEKVADLVNQS